MKKVLFTLMFGLWFYSCRYDKIMEEEQTETSIFEEKSKSRYKIDQRLIGFWVKSEHATQGVRFNEDGTMAPFQMKDPSKSGFTNIVVHIETYEKNGENYLTAHAYNENEQEALTKVFKYKFQNDTLYFPNFNTNDVTGEESINEYADKYFKIEL